jgi:hypothetical protein
VVSGILGRRCVVAKSRIWVCTKCKNSDCLLAFLKAAHAPKVRKVGCQKICKGPVVGLRTRGQTEWFSRVDRAKPMVALLNAAERGAKKVPQPLEDRRIQRRSGQAPR